MNVLNKDILEQLGQRLQARFTIFEGERRQLELQWLKNLRQYKAIYDPEIVIPAGRSKVYPKDTHTKIVGWVAKMMEMMFPAQDKNWSVETTPYPNIAEQDLRVIIQTLQQQQMAMAQQQAQAARQQGQPPQPPSPVTSAMIEKAVRDFADTRAAAMEKECEDQLEDSGLDYPELCKKVVRRGGIYGFGVAEGPLVRSVITREWQLDPTGQFAAISKSIPQPYYEALKAWDVYPDLSAPRWENQTGLFIRKVFPKSGIMELATRDDFFGEVINEYLSRTDKGNYKIHPYEPQLNEIKHTSQNLPDMTRQYEIIRYYGFVSARDLQAIGADVPESAIGKDILADVWLLDNVPIKADTAPFGTKVSDMFHVYIPEEDEDGPLTGTAKVEVLRDSQMKLCATDRMIMDNGASCCRAIVEVNHDLLEPESQGVDITGGMTVHRHGEGNEANYPAVRSIDIPSHITELLELRKSILEVFDVESNLPSWRMGNAQPLGEAFRTSNNMSMMASGGDMVTKDDVRAVDRFVKSLIGSLVRWNMEFNDKPEIKGDFNVQPRGNLSLVAKEVRGAALVQMKQTLTPRQQCLINDDAFLIEEFKTRDLPVGLVKTGDEATQALAAYDQQQQQAAQIQQGLDQSKTQKQTADAQKATASAQEIAAMVNARVQEKLSLVAANLAKAKGSTDSTALNAIQMMLDDHHQTADREQAAQQPAAPAGGEA
jgi:hypothetical protein